MNNLLFQSWKNPRKTAPASRPLLHSTRCATTHAVAAPTPEDPELGDQGGDVKVHFQPRGLTAHRHPAVLGPELGTRAGAGPALLGRLSLPQCPWRQQAQWETAHKAITGGVTRRPQTQGRRRVPTNPDGRPAGSPRPVAAPRALTPTAPTPGPSDATCRRKAWRTSMQPVRPEPWLAGI